MREILFRGKRTDNDEWVEGNLVWIKNYEKQLHHCFIISQLSYLEYGEFDEMYHQVFPETVGQYTGLTDKNGKKIFEGDIISAITLDTGTEQMAVVCFGNFIDENNSDEYIGFYIEFDGIKTTITQLAMEGVKDNFEVIGNIHENPELLKDGKER